MALQGTLDTFALPDVLRLLATTSKTGQLLVEGDRGNGSLFLTEGAIVAGETSLAATTVADEVLFELLRLADGSFRFEQGSTAEDPADPVDVESVIDGAESAHAEWQELATVVPSLDVGLQLADELPADTTTVDRDRWRLIVTVGSGTTVRRIGESLELSELPILRAVRGLVDDGLARIVDSTPDPVAPPATPAVSADPVVDTEPAATEPGTLPSLDEVPTGDLFGDDGVGPDLPEPLLDGTVGADGQALSPEEAAALEGQIEDLPQDQRALVEQAADAGDPAAADALLDELPDGAIDRNLMRRFLGSVRS